MVGVNRADCHDTWRGRAMDWRGVTELCVATEKGGVTELGGVTGCGGDSCPLYCPETMITLK